MFLRTINAIYIQAPYVKPQDQQAFLSYASCLFNGIEAHHHGEEESLFPEIERLTGNSGIMAENVSIRT